MIKSCYIHIPFCSTICSYCDFCKLFLKDKWIDEYLDALEKELKEIYQGEILDTIYIGGGTPSSLSLSQLERLFQILQNLKKSKNVEYTIEGNFESTTEEKLKIYQKYGINRLSFGLESIHSNNLDFLERKTDKKKVEEVIKTARKLGFSNINLDLMYALPTEDLKILKEDIQYVLSLQVEHISTYSLIIEEHTKLGIEKTRPIEEDLDYKMYQTICKTLKKNHYEHYEISNFAKQGYESKHNKTYWNNEFYYGFGLGACSYIDKKRIENTKSFSQYVKGYYQKEIIPISKEEKIEYEVMLNLRTKKGISLNLFYQKYDRRFEDCFEYDFLLQEKLLILEEERLFIPEDKWYISNEIIVKLLEGKKYE